MLMNQKARIMKDIKIRMTNHPNECVKDHLDEYFKDKKTYDYNKEPVIDIKKK